MVFASDYQTFPIVHSVTYFAKALFNFKSHLVSQETYTSNFIYAHESVWTSLRRFSRKTCVLRILVKQLLYRSGLVADTR